METGSSHWGTLMAICQLCSTAASSLQDESQDLNAPRRGVRPDETVSEPSSVQGKYNPPISADTVDGFRIVFRQSRSQLVFVTCYGKALQFREVQWGTAAINTPSPNKCRAPAGIVQQTIWCDQPAGRVNQRLDSSRGRRCGCVPAQRVALHRALLTRNLCAPS